MSDFKAAFSLFGEGPVGGALGNFFVTAPVVCVRESRAACWVVGGYVFVGAGIGGLSDSLLRPPPPVGRAAGDVQYLFLLTGDMSSAHCSLDVQGRSPREPVIAAAYGALF